MKVESQNQMKIKTLKLWIELDQLPHVFDVQFLNRLTQQLDFQRKHNQMRFLPSINTQHTKINFFNQKHEKKNHLNFINQLNKGRVRQIYAKGRKIQLEKNPMMNQNRSPNLSNSPYSPKLLNFPNAQRMCHSYDAKLQKFEKKQKEQILEMNPSRLIYQKNEDEDDVEDLVKYLIENQNFMK